MGFFLTMLWQTATHAIMQQKRQLSPFVFSAVFLKGPRKRFMLGPLSFTLVASDSRRFFRQKATVPSVFTNFRQERKREKQSKEEKTFSGVEIYRCRLFAFTQDSSSLVFLSVSIYMFHLAQITCNERLSFTRKSKPLGVLSNVLT